MPQPKKTQRIIKLLSGYEPDYSLITKKLTEKDIPTLNELVMHGSADIAPRAIICLAWFASEKSIPGIAFAAKSDNPVLRVTAAHALSSVSNRPDAIELISGLLDDRDVGVRKFALKTVGDSKISGLKEKVGQISVNDPNEQIRKLAQLAYDRLEAGNPSGS